MRYLLLAFALAAALIPAAAAAQTSPSGGPPGGGPPPDRAKFEQYRAIARTNALKVLTSDHQAKVQAVVDSFAAGSLKQRDAAEQINAILSPDETKALLAQQQQIRDAMIAMRGGNGGDNPPASQGGQMSQGGPQGRGPQSNAGRFLLRLLLTPQQARALRDQQTKQQ